MTFHFSMTIFNPPFHCLFICDPPLCFLMFSLLKCLCTTPCYCYAMPKINSNISIHMLQHVLPFKWQKSAVQALSVTNCMYYRYFERKILFNSISLDQQFPYLYVTKAFDVNHVAPASWLTILSCIIQATFGFTHLKTCMLYYVLPLLLTVPCWLLHGECLVHCS